MTKMKIYSAMIHGYFLCVDFVDVLEVDRTMKEFVDVLEVDRTMKHTNEHHKQ